MPKANMIPNDRERETATTILTTLSERQAGHIVSLYKGSAYKATSQIDRAAAIDPYLIEAVAQIIAASNRARESDVLTDIHKQLTKQYEHISEFSPSGVGWLGPDVAAAYHIAIGIVESAAKQAGYNLSKV